MENAVEGSEGGQQSKRLTRATAEQWAALRERNTLDELSSPEPVTGPADRRLEFAFGLPMPGVSYLELVPR